MICTGKGGRHPYIPLAIVMVFIGVAGCGEKTTPPASEMTFRVDSTLLGDRYADSHFSLLAPSGWARFPDSVVVRTMAVIAADSGYDSARDPRLQAVFRQTPGGAWLAVSDYRSTPSASELDSVAGRARRMLQQRFGITQVFEDTFTYHGFFVRQWRHAGEDSTQFKLVLSHNDMPVYQLDYALPRSVLADEMRKVESSIGSLAAEP